MQVSSPRQANGHFTPGCFQRIYHSLSSAILNIEVGYIEEESLEPWDFIEI